MGSEMCIRDRYKSELIITFLKRYRHIYIYIFLDPSCNKYCDLIGQEEVLFLIENLVPLTENFVENLVLLCSGHEAILESPWIQGYQNKEDVCCIVSFADPV